jgi:hypothetical protein
MPDELMPDRAGCVQRLAPVVPQVRPAHAAQHHPHDRVSRLLDDRIGPFAHLDHTGSLKYRSSHSEGLLDLSCLLLPQLQATTGWPTRGGPAVRGTGRTPFASGPHQPGMRPGSPACAPIQAQMAVIDAELAARDTRPT